MPTRSKDIDAIIAATPDWRGATLAKLRKITHEADPEMTEVVKWRKPSNPLGSAVFEHDGIVCIGILLKERVRLAFAQGASLPDPRRLFNAQLEGKVSRAIDFREGETPNKTALKALVRAGVARNRAKVKRAAAKKVRR